MKCVKFANKDTELQDNKKNKSRKYTKKERLLSVKCAKFALKN